MKYGQRSRSSIIKSQRINPSGTTREQSPKSCLAGLSNTWWSEVRKSLCGDGEMRVVPSQWTVWSDPILYTTRNQQHRPSPRNLEQKAVSFDFPDDGTITRREPGTNVRAVKHFRKYQRTFGRRARQRHTSTYPSAQDLKDPLSCARQSTRWSSELAWRM